MSTGTEFGNGDEYISTGLANNPIVLSALGLVELEEPVEKGLTDELGDNWKLFDSLSANLYICIFSK